MLGIPEATTRYDRLQMSESELHLLEAFHAPDLHAIVNCEGARSLH